MYAYIKIKKMMKADRITELIAELKSFKGKIIGVISHVRPDADCIGAQVGLCRWLTRQGIEAKAFNDDELSPNLKWISEHFPIAKTTLKAVRACDAYVFVDGNHPSRFGRAGEIVEKMGLPVYLIDHHPDPADLYKIRISDVGASSSCELVYDIFSHTPGILDLQSAEALYAGIVTDTGSFRFDSVTWRTHAAVTDLIKSTGLQTESIHRRIYDGKSLNQIHLLASVLGSIELKYENQLATIRVTRKMLANHESHYHDLEGMVNYGLSIIGVKASVLFCELHDHVKLSFRSASNIDVNVWARSFNGGGHVKASGGWFDGGLDEAIEKVMEVGAKQL